MPAQHYDRPQPGWKLISPGLYMDPEMQMHLFAGEMLAANGVPDTPANRAMLEKAFAEEFQRDYPGVPITETEGE